MAEALYTTCEATLDLAGTLDSVDIALVCGSGGVGKTSISASIAIAEAMRGRKVCVLTIDPARRLADAMGLDSLDDRERQVPLPGKPAKGGELWALMLDSQRAFDRMVAETAPDPESAQRILDNRLYRQIADHASAVQEYMAMERLYELDRGGRFDLLIVDTPPTAHSRDFLSAPTRLVRFLDGRSLRWFLKPGLRVGGIGMRALGAAGGIALQALQKITGAEALRDIAEFFGSFEGMYDIFRERARVIDRLLADPRTGFLIVTSPERESVQEAVEFWELLNDQQFHFLGTVVNRVEPQLPAEAASTKRIDSLPGIDTALAKRLREAVRDHSRIAQRDISQVALLEESTGDAPTVCVPRLPHAVSDLTSLSELHPYLYGGDAPA